MAEVTDPDGVEWSVDRRSFFAPDVVSPDGELTLLLVAIWPLWFIAHWLGVRWVIVIERAGSQVSEERVRGWGKSHRRIQEIAESVTAGTQINDL
jgi:hypothetical protein